MHESRQEKAPNQQPRSPQPTVERSAEKLAGQADPLIYQISQFGRTPSPMLSAALRDRSASSSPRTQQLLLQMQRQYGNRYVQRVMDLSRQGEGVAEAAPEVEAAIEQARGGGRSLDAGTQGQMESAFGTDFSGVRVHTDSTADTLNQALSARAFTTGQDIFFRQGEYNPGSSSGKELLAHELTHVVQQTGAIQAKLAVSQPGDHYEQEAEQVARVVVQRLATSQADIDPLTSTLDNILALQSRVGNQSVQSSTQTMPMTGAQSTVIQREPVSDDKTAKAVPAVVTEGQGTTPTTNVPGKSVNITLTALYEDVPGEAKDKVKRADADDALWFDPLTMHSNYPERKRSMQARGVVTGGQQTIDTFAAPVTESDNPVGRGSISAELKYASEQNKSFKVAVNGLSQKDTPPALAKAKALIQNNIETFGDIEDIAKETEEALAPTYPGAQVSITTVKDKVMDAGQSTFFYKVKHDAGILLNVLVAPVGEKQTRYSSSKITGSATEDESAKKDKSSTEKVDVKDVVKDTEKKTETSKESVETEYNEAVVRTLEDYVTKSTTIHNEVASDLAETVVKDYEYHKDDVWKDSKKYRKVEDFTKKVKGYTESGVKDKENWAAKIKKGIQIFKKATSIPFIDKIPGIGWITRRVKGWQLDLAEEVADLFAETGKVNYTDTKEDTTVKKDTTSKNDTTGRNDVDIKRHDEEETKRKLREDYKSKTKEEWERHLEDVTKTTKRYRSLTQKDSASTTDKTHTEDYSKTTQKDEHEAEQRHKESEHKTATATFEVSNTWKFTKPVIQATVVRGDAEVSNVPFPPEANEVQTKP